MRKNRKGRLLSALMALVMVCTMIPMMGDPAYADISYDLWVGTDEVTSSKQSGEGWSYDADSNTLTLTDANITEGVPVSDAVSGIYFGGSDVLNIVLEGENHIQSEEDDNLFGYGICSKGDIKITGDGSLFADGFFSAIRSSRHVDIYGGTVEATGTNIGIAAAGNVEIHGGSVTASGGYKAIVDGEGHLVVFGNRVLVMAGEDKDHARDVTGAYEENNAYKWVHTEKCTLFVGGIPVTDANAVDILGDLDEGATASYDDSSKTLTLNHYNYKSAGYKYMDDPATQYAAIYADQALNIVLEGENTVQCTETDSLTGDGIHIVHDEGGLIIKGSGTLTAAGYGEEGIGIYVDDANITIDGGTVTATGVNGLSANGGEIIIKDGIVTASSSSMGFSTNGVTVADDMAIIAGDSKETAAEVDKETFDTNHPQKWVHVAKAYPLWVGGKRVMITNMEDVLGDGKVSFDPGTNTLKLNGANITADPQHQKEGAAICYEGEENDLIIDATKESTVKGPDYGDSLENISYGISSKAPLVVKGKLTAIGTTGAINAIVKSDVPGLGWTNKEGTEGKTEFKANTHGQALGDKIKKAVFPAPAAAVTKAPKAKSLTYNGSAQELIAAGTASGGAMEYAIGKDNKTAPANGWSRSIPKGTKTGTYYVWYKAAGDEKHKDSEPGCVAAAIKTKPAPKIKGTLTARMTAKGKTGLTISWSKIQGAAGYDIFFAQCNHGGKQITCKKVKTVKGNKTFKWTKSNLRKGTSYKAYVKAYVMKNGKKSYVKTSPMVHAYTGNASGKYTNAKKVTVNKTEVTLKKDKTFQIKASVKKVKKSKKLMPKRHVTTIRYMSSDKKVATVSTRGKITARGKGSCYIYVYAHNGVSKKIKVTVK